VFYPNPVQDKLNVYCSGTDQEVLITVSDLSGKQHGTYMEKVPESRTIQLTLEELASGMYLLHIEGTKLNETIKIIKK
jgi:hypothetical protein